MDAYCRRIMEVHGLAYHSPDDRLRNATVLVRCRGEVSVEARTLVGPRSEPSLGTAPCDGQVHAIAEGVDIPNGVTISSADGDGRSVAYQALIVVPT